MDTPLARRANEHMTVDTATDGSPARDSARLDGASALGDAHSLPFGSRIITRRLSNGVPVVTTRLATAAAVTDSAQWLGNELGSIPRWDDARVGAETPARGVGAFGYRAGLAKLLDTLAEGLVLCDQIGRIIHANRAASRMLTDEMERARLHGEVRTVAQALHDRMHRRSRAADLGSNPSADEVVEREFETARARFTLRATYLGAGLLPGAGGAVLVAVDRPAAAALSRTQLQARYCLTAREVDVAIELAHGRSNAAIARALSISPHTARHHAEKIFLKLGVHSRAEVGRLVLGGAS
jgi:DNA-binding CsgD family transcriptional regulator